MKKNRKSTVSQFESQKRSKTEPIVSLDKPEPKPSEIWPYVTLSVLDKAKQIILSSDRMQCAGIEGGYRMIRSSHGVDRGEYYFEVEILNCGPQANLTPVPMFHDIHNPSRFDPHIRIGWSTRLGDLQASVGFDEHSFGYCDLHGSKIHKSRRMDHYGEPFTRGDIIGCYIRLDHLKPEKNEIRFIKNGIDQGVAFSGGDVIPGNKQYFPAISLFMNASVRVNFGPTFIIPQEEWAIRTQRKREQQQQQFEQEQRENQQMEQERDFHLSDKNIKQEHNDQSDSNSQSILTTTATTTTTNSTINTPTILSASTPSTSFASDSTTTTTTSSSTSSSSDLLFIPVSELQPLSPEDRKIHERKVQNIRFRFLKREKTHCAKKEN